MADPYWERFCAPLAHRILALIREQTAPAAAGGDAPFILEEPIAAVLGDGRYTVGGDALAAKGTALLQVGQRVHVLWRRGKRALILTHQWKRAQGQGEEAGGPVVEELWVAGTEVWFRNADTVAPLELGRFALPGSLGDIGWGARADRFFVQHTTATFVPGTGLRFDHHVSVFKFDREPDAPLPAGTDPAGAITLERTHVFATDPYVVAHYNPGGPGTMAVDLRVADTGQGRIGGFDLSIGIDAIALSDAGHLVVAFNVQSTLFSISAPIPGLEPATTSTTWSFAHPVVVDLDTHTKLLDAFADGAAAWGPESGLVVNAYPIAGFPVVLEAVLGPGGPYIHYPEEDQWQRFTISHLLVVGERLMAFIGMSQRERRRTGWSDANGYPVIYTPRHRTLVAQPPPPGALLVLVPGSALYPNDLRYDANETHVLWHTVVPEGEDAYWQAALTSFELGTTQPAGRSQARFFDRNVRLLGPSFAWQPAASLPVQPEEERDRFLLLWDFDSGAILVEPTGSDVSEDEALVPAKAMADLPPEAPAQPRNRGALEIHVINREEALGPLGRYRPHAEPAPETPTARPSPTPPS